MPKANCGGLWLVSAGTSFGTKPIREDIARLESQATIDGCPQESFIKVTLEIRYVGAVCDRG